MINILALALLVSSLAAAGVWSPPPSMPTDPHLFREGHRLLVVEYERRVPSETPSPPSTTTTTTTHNIIEEVKEKFQEASPLLPDLGQGISTPASTAVEKPAHSAKDLICDAYGSCKEKISSVFHKGKDKISRKASDVGECAREAVERAKEKASDIKEGAKDAVRSTVEKASEIEEQAKDAVKGAVREVAEVTMGGGEDAMGNTWRVAGQAVDRAEETTILLHRNLTDILNRARDVAFDAAKYVGASETGRAVAEMAHMLAFVVAYGTSVWVTFVSSDVLATVLPRQQFGMVQSKLYKVYFRALACAIGIACLGHFFAKKRVVGAERVQDYNLLTALGLVLVNMFYLEPKATKVMFKRMKMEKEEGRGRDMADVIGGPVMTSATTTTTATTQSAATTIGVRSVRRTSVAEAVDHEAVKSRAAKLNKNLRKLNSYSSFLNILTLMSFTWHLVNLAQRLQRTC